jgi:transcriptional regulator with GAF, ATPase, and Fis domain
MTESPTTLSETAESDGSSDSTNALGLAIVWAADEPGRIGEVALIASGAPGPMKVLGRGSAASDDAHERLSFARLRGRTSEVCPALETPRLSRVQLTVRSRDDGALEVENVGRLRLLANGTPCARAVARPGDTLQLGAQFLLLVVHREVREAPASRPAPPSFPFGVSDSAGIVGESPAIWRLRERIAFVGRRRGHVLVVGPSGSGKELVARAVHAASDRAERPLRTRNAATIPDSLADAELFGNARNYPNAGMPERGGIIGDSDGTSLFLDEFGELSSAVQAHLLRALDGGDYQRLGESVVRHSNFRLIAATNRPLSAIKPDVLARLTLRIEVPGLEARKEDVPLLARHILSRILATDSGLAKRFSTPDRGLCVPTLSLGLVRDLLGRDFATHAREIEEILWRGLETSVSGIIGPAVPDGPNAMPTPRQGTTLPPDGGSEEALSPETIQRCLDAHNGVIEDTWKALGLSSRHALTRLVRKHGLEVRKRFAR